MSSLSTAPVACLEENPTSLTIYFAGQPINARKVALTTSLSKSHVCRVLRGEKEPSLPMGRAIAAALGMDFFDFLRELELRGEQLRAKDEADVKRYTDRIEREDKADLDHYKRGKPVIPRPAIFRAQNTLNKC